MGLNIGQVDPQTLQKLLFGSPQSAMFGADPTAAPQPPAPTPDAQPRGSIADAMPAQQEQPQAAPPPQPAQPAHGSIAASMPQQQPTAQAPPQNAPIPQAPTPYHHGTLAKIMLGIGEAVGNPLATHIGERDRARQQEVDEYGRNLPVTQYQANVGQQKTKAELLREQAQTEEATAQTAHTQAETSNLALNPPGKAEFLKELQVRRSGGSDDPQQLFNEYVVRAPYSHVTRQEIADVISNTPVKPFNFETKDGAIQPGSYLGKSYGPDAGQGEPPEIGTARTNALASIKQGQTGKIAVAKQEAAARQAVLAGGFGQAGDPMVDMVGQGRVDLATALQRIPPQAKESFMSSLSAKYPGFNQANYGISKGVGEAFTSGSQGQQLTAINTAREHMKTFSQLAEAPNNGDVQILNKIGNTLGVQFGSDKATNFKIAAQAFGGEVGKAFDGAGVTEGERKSAQNSFNDQMSKGQFKGAIQTVDALLAGKQRSLKQSYESGKEGKPNFGSEQQGGGTQEGPTATGPNGHKIKVVGGKWVDATTGKPI